MPSTLKAQILTIRLLNGLGFLTGNWYCYQAVAEDLFHHVQRPDQVGSGHGSKILTRFHLWVDQHTC